MPQSWLIIERLENWEVDRAANFAMFGLSNRYKNSAQRIGKDDLIFTYVSSGVSAFADIRIVQTSGTKPLRRSDYDAVFDFYISTAPVLILARPHWVPLRGLLHLLDLTKERAEWRQMFRTSLRLLSGHDARLIKTRMEQRQNSA